ncbi:MAG: class I SAM-dependent methyltransferase, partial [Deltaproteobacteria bacterium]|nr:class I SAM-dependent methyltransferase [Deltaproteobacteria bacterium]
DCQSPILDIGGGAGALSRRLLQDLPKGRAVLLEMAEILTAARKLYPRKNQWTGMELRPGDFRNTKFTERFATIIMANILHIYAPDEARRLLAKAAGLLVPGGLLLVHDYFPDRPGPALAKGSLYDLNMMLNTCEGRCHDSGSIAAWFKEAGLSAIEINDLNSDSGIICARSKR